MTIELHPILPACPARSPLESATHTLTQSIPGDESTPTTSTITSSSSLSESDPLPDPPIAPPLGPLPLDGYIKHYEIIRQLGEGGMGIVLLARDTKLGRLVAIKLLHDSGQAALRIRAEAQTTARATHDNIVVIYEVGEFEGHPYMVLEYVEGRTLREVISTGRRGDGRALAPGFALDIMVSVVRALAAAHKSGIVHRDLKPANIMLRDSGQVKLLDFGIARPADSNKPIRHAGTRPYMAPEQWLGSELDERCDLWAAGLIFYELLTGAHPLAPITPEKLEAIADLERPMPSLSDVRPELSTISEVIGRCLRKKKEERFSSADELLAALEACSASGGSATRKSDELPFAGLAAFQEADADRFFGRAPDVAAVLGSLARQALVAVTGPSGAGKSSFIRAGVIPALKRSGEEWDVLVIRPGRTPLAALHEALTVTLATTIVEGDFTTQPGLLGKLLRAHCRARGPTQRMLIFVDQFEELYTLVPDENERAAFRALLLGAADDASSPLRVIVAIRSDFFDRIVEDRHFMAHVRSGLFFLPPLDDGRLREALTRPVEAAGYQFENAAMVALMLDELSATRSPLPLLQFAASQLWEARDQERKMLTRQSYEKLGGVAGALATRADVVLAGLSAPEQRLCRAIFLRLVTPERTRAIVPLRELGALTEDAAAVEAVVQHLCDARLLLLDAADESGSARLELVHESLIERWPTLTRWLNENADDAQFLARVRAAASQWEASGEPSGLLWRDRAAEEVRAFYERHRRSGSEMPSAFCGKLEERYLQAVMDLFERNRRRWQWFIGGAFVFISAVALVVFFLALRARDQAQLADTHAKRADAEAMLVKEQNETLAFQALRGRNAMRMLAARKRQDDPTLVLALLREVESQEIPKEWSELLSPALSQGVASAVRLETGPRPVYDASISPDGTRIVAAMNDHVALILDADTLEERRVLKGHEDYVWTAAWSPDGKRIVTASGDKTARAWSVDGTAEPLILRHDAAVHAAKFSPDGKLVATASADATARVFSAIDGKTLSIRRHPTDVLFSEFSPDSRRIATGGPDGITRVWNADGIGEPLLLRGHTNSVVAAAFHPDGTSLATASRDQTIRVWDVSSGTERFVLRGHEDQVRGVSWSPDGKHIASASRDKTVRVWNADGNGAPLVLRGHEHWLYTAKFSPDSRRLVTASLDRSIRVWNLDRILAPVLIQKSTGNITQFRFSPDSQRYAMVEWEELTVGNTPGTGAGRVLPGRLSRFAFLTWSPDSTRIATASCDQGTLIWNADGSRAPLVLRDGPQDETLGIAWCAESDEIIAVSRAGLIRRWSSEGQLLSTATATFDPVESVVRIFADSSCTRLLVTAARNPFVQVWNMRDGGQLVTIGKRDATVADAVWSPDGSRVLVVYADHVARIWNIDGTLVTTFADSVTVTDAKFDPDGRRVALVFDDGRVHIWNADGTGEPLAFGISGNRLTQVEWSPDGTRLITVSADRIARVWNADGSGIPFALVGPRTQINQALWSPDGRYIAVNSDEPVAYVWPDVHPFTGPEDPRLWRATSYCIPPAIRVELLGVTDAEAREAEATCKQRIAKARAATQ